MRNKSVRCPSYDSFLQVHDTWKLLNPQAHWFMSGLGRIEWFESAVGSWTGASTAAQHQGSGKLDP